MEEIVKVSRADAGDWALSVKSRGLTGKLS